jgi:hypothetical protein
MRRFAEFGFIVALSQILSFEMASRLLKAKTPVDIAAIRERIRSNT